MRCALLIFALIPLVAVADESPDAVRLPDPLTMADGTPVRTPAEWFKQRRPELKALFQQHVYGFLPPAGEIEAHVTNTVPDLLGGKATLKEVEIRFPWLNCPAGKTAPVLHLAVFLPNAATETVPVFVGLNRRGNHAVLADDRITPTPNAADANMPAARGEAADTWCVELLIDRGYGFATFVVDDIDPDVHDFTDGLHACLSNDGVPKGAEPGTIAAWAWGFHRAVDYLVTDPQVNAEQIAIIGHSRRGKTALLAAAFDERIALTVPHQSGTGGMALSRGNDQETVARINKNFPHWFADNFNAYSDHEDSLPVDQHLLVALVAPRALLDTGGLKDTWANYPSALRTLRAADPVYTFLGVRGLVGDGVLTAGDAINAQTAGHLLQYRLKKVHVLDADYWAAILDFADLQFGRQASK